MNPALAAEVELLSDVGWRVVSQTETTASLETRGPFIWWVLVITMLTFPILGSTIYILWWLIFDRHDVFVAVENDKVMTVGDTWLVERQKADLAKARWFRREVKEKGFWRATWPSIIALGVGIVMWFIVIWAFIQIID